MRKAGFALLLVAAMLVGTNALCVRAAQQETIPDSINAFCGETKCSAVSAVVVNGEETEFYGDETGLYQIGSMTKAFTGLAVQKLIREGALHEEDCISELLPGFTAFYDSAPAEITIGQLLAQTSGYTDKESDYPGASPDMSLEEWVQTISGRALRTRPGETYAYSNVNYNLLGAVIGQVSGKPYEEYMYEEILLPLGLTNTYVGMPDGERRMVPGARLGYRMPFPYEIPVSEGSIPAGYFYSNTTDLARWIRIWLGTADIPEEYRELVYYVKTRLKEPGDYDSGWERFENDVTGHSGGTPNYSSRIVFSEKEKIGVCVLTNMNVAASTDALCNGIFSIAAGGRAGKIAMDVWTIFDLVFSVVSVIGILLIAAELLTKKRGVTIILGAVAAVLLLAVCIVMPAVFGAGLGEILLTWAPYSVAGGLLVFAASIPVTIIKILVTRNNENRKKTG